MANSKRRRRRKGGVGERGHPGGQGQVTGEHRPYVSMLPLSRWPVTSVSLSLACVCPSTFAIGTAPSPSPRPSKLPFASGLPWPSSGLQQRLCLGACWHCRVSGRHPRPAQSESGLEPGSTMGSPRSECRASYVTQALSAKSDCKTPPPRSKLPRITRP